MCNRLVDVHWACITHHLLLVRFHASIISKPASSSSFFHIGPAKGHLLREGCIKLTGQDGELTIY